MGKIDEHNWGVSASAISWVPHERMPKELAAADAFVLPSLSCPYWEEQLGFALIEAMMAGLPILSTASGSIPDVVGDAGVLVPPYDTGALAAGMERLLDPAERAFFGNAGRARALEHFDAAKQARLLARAMHPDVLLNV